MHALVKSSSEKALQYYGVVFPNDSWWIKSVVAIANIFVRLGSSSFRIFIHSTEDIEKIIHNNGLKRDAYKRGLFWQMIVYQR